MEWLIIISTGAIFICLWHEFNRFPATNKSIFELYEKIEVLELGNSDLCEKIGRLDSEVLSLSNEIDKIKDPAYDQAIEYGDGHALYELDKARGNI